MNTRCKRVFILLIVHCGEFLDLIDRYEAFEYGILPNALIVLSTSKKYPLLMEEMRVAEHIAEMSKGVIRFIVKTDDALEKELRMNIAFTW